MLIISFFLLISLLISIMLMLLANMMGSKFFLDNQKLSPYECGFNPHSKARMPFSLRFFLVIIIFLIFDVEITLLLPLGLLISKWNYLYMNMLLIILVLLMIMGFIHEWNQGSLNWLY